MKLYHTTLKTNLDSIREKGLDPAFSQGAEKVVWLHTKSRSEWAILHILKRHRCTIDDIIVIEVNVSRSKLRRRWRGLWTTPETIKTFASITGAEVFARSPFE